MLKELDGLFESETIKPTFEYVHIVLALYMFGENSEGLGRYRLKQELLIGSGTARSLITKLKTKSDFLTVVNVHTRKGHILTEKGIKFLNKLQVKIPFLEEGDLEKLREIIIESKEIHTYLCLVKNIGNKITSGIAQRDAAIKVGGIGTTCLIYSDNNLRFPTKSFSKEDLNQMLIDKKVQEYLKLRVKENKSKLEENDAILIGLGESPASARLSVMNAALTLITNTK